MQGILLLQRFISNHPYLKVEDSSVVQRICEGLTITDNTGYINEHFRQQVEMEASVVYLANKYVVLVSKLQEILINHKAGKFIELGDKTDEGYKWTLKGKEVWLRGTDLEFLMHCENLIKAEQLLDVLKDLRSIVFNRDRKLEQVSNNYRKEVEIDKRTGR